MYYNISQGAYYLYDDKIYYNLRGWCVYIKLIMKISDEK